MQKGGRDIRIKADKELNNLIAEQLRNNKSTIEETDSLLPMALLLKCISSNGMITASACSNYMSIVTKERKVRSHCDLSKIKIRPDDGRMYLIIDRKTISSNTYEGLLDKLIDYFYGTNMTVEKYFPKWKQFRKEYSAVTDKTRKEDEFLWNKYIKDSELAKKKIAELKVRDFKMFFRSITKNRELTRKRFNNIKSVLNGMMYLAVEEELIPHNPITDINFREFAYKAEDMNVFPYTEEERQKLLSSIGDSDLIDLAIKLDFYLVLRIGELKTLKWSDIHGDFIHIHAYMNSDKEVVENDIKGHASAGMRVLPLVKATKEILEKIRELNPESEYLFINDDFVIDTGTFNRRIRKHCKELGIEYRSSHKVRFSTASILNKNGVPETTISKMLGHTTLQMTRHYLRDISSRDETAQLMENVLG